MRPYRAGVRFSLRMRVGSCLLLLVACAPVPDEPAAEPLPAAPEASRDVTADASLAWHWVRYENDAEFPQVRDVVAGDDRYRFLVVDDRVRIVKVGTEGTAWSVDLPGQGLDGGFLLLVGSRLFVAQHSHIASGARVYALDAQTGAMQWQADVYGLGPVDHSKYRNRVQLDADEHALLVYGDEAQGRYVEALSLETGKMLGNLRVDDAVVDIP